MNKNKFKILAVSFAVLLVLVGVLLWQNLDNEGQQVSGPNSQQNSTENNDGVFVDKREKRFTLMMVGDNLLHMGIIQTGYRDDGTRNYDFLFDDITEHLGAADIKVINQETIFGGNDLGFSGYPAFNSPTEVGDAIVKAGFNVVLHSSNHSADKGLKGLKHCLKFWEQYPEVTITGIYDVTEEEAAASNPNINLVQMRGVTFAFLNYTYGPNLETLPSSFRTRLGMLCDWDKKTGKIDFTTLHPDVISDIKEAEELADFVIVCPHWGNEYETKESRLQNKFAEQMVEAGADLILGTHSHCIQPIEWVESPNGNRALCYYSLGNYVSTQRMTVSLLEAMAWVTIVADENGVHIDERETGVIPMVCHYKSNPTRFKDVYFLDEYTDELARSHGMHVHTTEDFSLRALNRLANRVLGDWIFGSDEVLEFGKNRDKEITFQEAYNLLQ